MVVQVIVKPAETVCRCTASEANERSEADNKIKDKNVPEDYREVTLFRSLRPLILIAKVFGLYCEKKFPLDADAGERLTWGESQCPEYRQKRNAERKRSPVTPSQVYCMIIMVLLYVNTARLFTGIDPSNGFGPILFNQMVAILWSLLCSVNSTAMYIGWARKRSLPNYFLLWQELHPHKQEASTVCQHKIKQRVVIYIVTLLLANLTNIAFVIYLTMKTQAFEPFLAPLTLQNGEWTRVLLLVYVLTLYVYLSASWTIPFAFAFILCIGCRMEFQKFNYELRSELSSDGTFNGDIELYRRRHQKICRLVEHADGYFHVQAAASFIFNSCIVLLLLYNLSGGVFGSDPIIILTGLFWMSTSLLGMAITSIGAATVNDEAHAAIDVLYDMSVDSTKDHQNTQIMLFLSRLNGPSIGPSVLRVFVIDRPMILTLVGLLVTYFVLIVQFAPISGNDSGSNCNCTSSN